MKKILTLFLLLTAFVAVQAQNAMVLSMKDGSKNVVYIKAPESSPGMIPYITFEGDDIVIRGDHELRVAMSDVQRYVYTDTPAGIDAVGDATPTVVFDRNEIHVFNQPANAVIEVYAVNGSLVKSAASHNEKATVNLGNLPSGVYLVKVGSATYKFVKR